MSITEVSAVYRGFLYVVKLCNNGYRRGFIELKKEHPLYGKNGEQLATGEYSGKKIKCDRFLNYGGIVSDKTDDNYYSLPCGFWIGFGGSREDDVPDREASVAAFGHMTEYTNDLSTEEATLKTTAFCVAQCEKIIDQLIFAGRRNTNIRMIGGHR
jgi:hypothetical protein